MANQPLDPILIKLWNLLRISSGCATSDCMSGMTAAHSRQTGARAPSAISKLSSGPSRYAEDTRSYRQIKPTQIIREKEYFRLLMTIQIGLFLVNENQMYRVDKLHAFKKQWDSISRKNVKGFTFKDF